MMRLHMLRHTPDFDAQRVAQGRALLRVPLERRVGHQCGVMMIRAIDFILGVIDLMLFQCTHNGKARTCRHCERERMYWK